MYSNSCCSCSFKLEIIKIGQSSHTMYSNNIVNFRVSTTILNACKKKVRKPIECTTYFLQKKKENVHITFCSLRYVDFLLTLYYLFHKAPNSNNHSTKMLTHRTLSLRDCGSHTLSSCLNNNRKCKIL